MLNYSQRLTPALFILLCLNVVFAVPQDEDESKSIKAERFIQERPATTSRTSARYRKVKSTTNEQSAAIRPKSIALGDIGITIWRFRPAQPMDQTKELVEEEEGRQTEWTLERVEEGTRFSIGQRVRLSIESLSRSGYLYVINREEYGDGTLGDPVLIFPTKKSAGANHVKAGRLVYIPSATGRFKINPSQTSKSHVGELITVIVSPTPLIPADRLGDRRTPLERKLVEGWQKQWDALSAKFEMEGGVGQAMTPIEQSASRESSSLLTQNDPTPQTIFQLGGKPTNPLWIAIPLRFAKPN
ncbi:MAG TPA: DUF4384 domain-containing protein [Pyrinomonadaceae bacterium]|nr:DUF4384 domain-containing protein [Pyrinomonadaceae bacterium]